MSDEGRLWLVCLCLCGMIGRVAIVCYPLVHVCLYHRAAWLEHQKHGWFISGIMYCIYLFVHVFTTCSFRELV